MDVDEVTDEMIEEVGQYVGHHDWDTQQFKAAAIAWAVTLYGDRKKSS